MTEELAKRLSQLPPETIRFLADLSHDDIQTLENGLPMIRQVMSFGKVAKWLAIAALSILAGTVLLGESISKIIGWIKP